MSDIQQIINGFNSNNGEVSVLEAGCGSLSRFDFNSKYSITGIDISSKQLDRNENIHRKIKGDIQTYKFESNSFDIIICYHVLEHLAKPVLALNNFFNSIKNNGVIIISCPDPLSLKGLVTKLTPLWFHVFVHKHIYGQNYAGTEDHGPFKTYMRFSMSKNSIIKRAEQNGLHCEVNLSGDALDGWAGDSFRQKTPILFYLLKTSAKLLKIISFGRIGNSEYTLVLRKN